MRKIPSAATEYDIEQMPYLQSVADNRRGALRQYLPIYMNNWKREIQEYRDNHSAGKAINLRSLTTHSRENAKSLENLYTTAKSTDNNERTFIANYRNKYKGEICPYCCGSGCGTLDHYYPKTVVPQFSIIPENLVPCCHRCNTVKGTITPNSDSERFIHPFFDPFDICNGHFEILPVMQSGILKFVIQANSALSKTECETIQFHIEKLQFNIYLQGEIQSQVRRIFDEIQSSILAGMPEANIHIKLGHMISIHRDRVKKNYWHLILLESILKHYQQFMQAQIMIK